MMKRVMISKAGGVHRQAAITLLEMFVVIAVLNIAFLGYLLLADRAMSTAAWGRDMTLALTMAQNELEWWQSASAEARANLGPGDHNFANPTAENIRQPFTARLHVEPVGDSLLLLRAVVQREHWHRPVQIELETLIPREGGQRQ